MDWNGREEANVQNSNEAIRAAITHAIARKFARKEYRDGHLHMYNRFLLTEKIMRKSVGTPTIFLLVDFKGHSTW